MQGSGWEPATTALGLSPSPSPSPSPAHRCGARKDDPSWSISPPPHRGVASLRWGKGFSLRKQIPSKMFPRSRKEKRNGGFSEVRSSKTPASETEQETEQPATGLAPDAVRDYFGASGGIGREPGSPQSEPAVRTRPLGGVRPASLKHDEEKPPGPRCFVSRSF